LLHRLGYVRHGGGMTHPHGRRAVFIGDLTDRGPYSVSTILLVDAMVRSGDALYVPGNHCRKLYRYLSGADVMVRHGLETTVRELDALSRRERQAVSRAFRRLYDDAPPYMILDDGRLVVVHAGIKEDMIGRTSKGIERFCLYGEATGERTPEGFPVRRDWARDYRGDALVVYGHTPVRDAVFRFNTVNIDQGCVFGGKLTALRYPEREIVQAPARAAYEARAAFRDLPPEPRAPGTVSSPEAEANPFPVTRANGAAGPSRAVSAAGRFRSGQR